MQAHRALEIIDKEQADPRILKEVPHTCEYSVAAVFRIDQGPVIERLPETGWTGPQRAIAGSVLLRSWATETNSWCAINSRM